MAPLAFPLIALTLALAAPGPSAVQAPQPAATEAVVDTAAVRPRRLSPMGLEMQQVMDKEKEALAGLQARFAAARDAAAALAVQREIERLKVETEVALLRIQAGYARRAGQLEAAQRIEAAIEGILNPVKPQAPAKRQVAPRAPAQAGR